MFSLFILLISLLDVGMKNSHMQENAKSSGGGGGKAARLQRLLSAGLGTSNGTTSHDPLENARMLGKIAEDDGNIRLIKRNRHKSLRRTSSGASSSSL